ncbi:RIKEN cDNA 5033414D02, isoform CRA_b, partial [Mus musculus]
TVPALIALELWLEASAAVTVPAPCRVRSPEGHSCLPSIFNRVPEISPDTSKVQVQESKAQKEVKMGFIFSKSMNENMKNQQEFMVTHARLQVKLRTYWKQKRRSWSCQKD